MADNTKNDGDKSRKSAPKRSTSRSNERKSAPRNERRAEANDKPETKRKPQPKRNEGKRRDFQLEGANRVWALGAAAVAAAGVAGAVYAAWRHHADEHSNSLFGDDDDDTSFESANVEGATFATNGTTPKTTRRTSKAARDVIDGDDRSAFAPATVPVGETERTDSPATA